MGWCKHYGKDYHYDDSKYYCQINRWESLDDSYKKRYCQASNHANCPWYQNENFDKPQKEAFSDLRERLEYAEECGEYWRSEAEKYSDMYNQTIKENKKLVSAINKVTQIALKTLEYNEELMSKLYREEKDGDLKTECQIRFKSDQGERILLHEGYVLLYMEEMLRHCRDSINGINKEIERVNPILNKK